MLHERRRPRRLIAATLATVALVAMPAAAFAKIDTTATTCTISSGTASLTVAWKGRDPDTVWAQYVAPDGAGGFGQFNDVVAVGVAEKSANALTMSLSAPPTEPVTVRFQTSTNRTSDQVQVTCTGV